MQELLEADEGDAPAAAADPLSGHPEPNDVEREREREKESERKRDRKRERRMSMCSNSEGEVDTLPVLLSDAQLQAVKQVGIFTFCPEGVM